MYSPLSNHFIINGNIDNTATFMASSTGVSFSSSDVDYFNDRYSFYFTWKTESLNILNSNDYSTIIKNK